MFAAVVNFVKKTKQEIKMARIIGTVPAIRCCQSGCKTLFEVAPVEEGKQQEVVCPACGEHYIYPPAPKSENNER